MRRKQRVTGRLLVVVVLVLATAGAGLSGTAGAQDAGDAPSGDAPSAVPPPQAPAAETVVSDGPSPDEPGLPPELTEQPAKRVERAERPAAPSASSADDGLDAPSAGGSISGTVTAQGVGPVQGVFVDIWDTTAQEYIAFAETDVNGQYTVPDLPFGTYEVGFFPEPPLAWEWWNDQHHAGPATQVFVPGTDVTGINAVLETVGTISGTVTASGSPVPGATVLAADTFGNVIEGAITNASGQYTIADLTPASYKVFFEAPDGSGLLNEFYNAVPDFSSAALVAVASGANVTGINATLDSGGSISGTVTNEWGHPLPATFVYALDPGTFDTLALGFTDLDGNYVLNGLVGPYLIYFVSFDGTYLAELYDGAPDPSTATVVDVIPPGAVTGIDADLEQAPTGFLRATTSPALPVDIIVDGIPRDAWGLTWPDFPVGEHEVCFEDIIGWTTPPCQTVEVTAGVTTEVVGTYTQRGFLRVLTNPALPATVSVDGVAMNEWGMWTDLAPGMYDVCFGAIAGFLPPPCQNDVVVTAGATSTVTGNYTADGGAPGPVGDHGFLRATTNPAVGAKIIVDGQERDSWGLTWLKLPVGVHEVCFGSVPDLVTPPCEDIVIGSGATTEVAGTYTVEGFLRVLTSPAVPVWISIDGFISNAWGVWRSIPPGDHLVCYGPIGGLTAPTCDTVNVTSGAFTQIIGTYT